MTVPNSPETKNFAWLALAVLALLSLSAMFLLGSGVMLILVSLPMIIDHSNADQVQSLFMLGSGMIFLAFLMMPGIYFNVRHFFGQDEPSLSLPAISDRILLPVMLVLWLLALGAGKLVESTEWGRLFVLPILNVPAILLPILFYLRIAWHGFKVDYPRRRWSIFGISIVIGPFVAFVVEGMLFAVAFLVVVFYVSSAGNWEQVRALVLQLQNTTSPEELTRLLEPIVGRPAALLTALGFLSISTPIIEEFVKLSGVWIFGRRLRPIEGFLYGALGGAAFAIAENLEFSVTSGNEWAVALMTRATSALPHIANSALLGWALVSFWRKKGGVLQLGMAFLAVLLIHGLWNGIGLWMWVGSLLEPGPGIPAFLTDSITPTVAWSVLIAGLFTTLWFFNARLHRIEEQPPE